MTEISGKSSKKLYRLWSVPLFVFGLMRLAEGYGGNMPHHVLMGAAMLCTGVYAFRQNILDLSQEALNPSNARVVSIAFMGAGILLAVAALVVKFTA